MYFYPDYPKLQTCHNLQNNSMKNIESFSNRNLTKTVTSLKENLTLKKRLIKKFEGTEKISSNDSITSSSTKNQILKENDRLRCRIKYNCYENNYKNWVYLSKYKLKNDSISCIKDLTSSNRNQLIELSKQKNIIHLERASPLKTKEVATTTKKVVKTLNKETSITIRPSTKKFNRQMTNIDDNQQIKANLLNNDNHKAQSSFFWIDDDANKQNSSLIKKCFDKNILKKFGFETKFDLERIIRSRSSGKALTNVNEDVKSDDQIEINRKLRILKENIVFMKGIFDYANPLFIRTKLNLNKSKINFRRTFSNEMNKEANLKNSFSSQTILKINYLNNTNSTSFLLRKKKSENEEKIKNLKKFKIISPLTIFSLNKVNN